MSDRPTQFCPKCRKYFTPILMVLDGGNKVCPTCKTHCHTCPDGSISLESPIHCNKCNEQKEQKRYKNKDSK